MSGTANGEGPRASAAASVPQQGVTAGTPSRWGAPVQLVGRDPEVEIIRAFLDRAYGDGGAFLISGDAGVGKSVLIDAAAAYAASIGFTVVRATGAQFEANVSFAGLHQVLYPLLNNLDQLDELQRRALESAFGLRQGAAPDRMTISHAALELLVRSAASAAVLIVVDDMPWLDQVSAMILGFVARRAAGTRIGFLAAARTGEEGFFDQAGIPTYTLSPLSDSSSQALLDSHYPALAARARRRLLAEAQGNPLALLELPIALTSTTHRSLNPTLPLTRRLQDVFASRIHDVPDRTRHALLLIVLDGTDDLRVLRLGEPDSEIDDLRPAERAQVIAVDRAAARVSFRHPLIRSAVMELATGDERRRAHLILAERRADQPARRAWHLAEASIGPDEQWPLCCRTSPTRTCSAVTRSARSASCCARLTSVRTVPIEAAAWRKRPTWEQ